MAIEISIVLRDPGVESKIKRLDERFRAFTDTVRTLRHELEGLGAALQAIGAVNVPRMGGGGFGPATGGRSAGGRPPRPVAPQVGAAFARIGSASQAAQARDFISQVDALGGSAARNQVQARNRAMKALQGYQKANDPAEILKAAILRTRWVNVFGRKIGMPLGVDSMRVAAKLPGMQGMFGDLGQALGMGGNAAGGGGAVPPVIGAGGAAGAGGAGGAFGGIARAAMMAAGPVAAVAGPLLAIAAAAKFAYRESERSVAAYRKQTILMATMAADARAASTMSGFERLAPGSTGAGMRSLSGMEASVAASIGLNPMTGLGGDMDYATRNRRIVQALRRAQSARERQIILEAFPEMAGMAGPAQFLNDSDFARLMRGGRGMSDRQRANVAKFDFENERIQQNLGGLRDRMGAGLAGPMGRITGVVNRVLESPAMRMFETVVETLIGSQMGTANGLAMVMERLLDAVTGLGQRDDTNRQIERNTRQTAEWIKDIRDGTYGGGERAGRVNRPIGASNYNTGAHRDVGSSLI